MNLKKTENNNEKTNELEKHNPKFWSRVKSRIVDHKKYNKHNLILKISISSFLLALATGLSFLEFSFPTPWGTHFYFRFIDTLVLIFSIGIVGLLFSTLIAITTPWLHFAFHGHNPIENLIFMASNILIVFCLWLIYYQIFKLDVRKKCGVQIDNEQKEVSEHRHRFEKEKWFKKILVIILLVIIFALIEAFAQITVAKIMLTNNHSHHNHSHHNHSHGVSGLFEGNNFWIGLGIFCGAYVAKYVFIFTVFIGLEKQIKLITDRFQMVV